MMLPLAPPIVQYSIDSAALTHMLERHVLNLESHGREGQQADLSCYIISDYDFSGLNLSSIQAQDTTFH